MKNKKEHYLFHEKLTLLKSYNNKQKNGENNLKIFVDTKKKFSSTLLFVQKVFVEMSTGKEIHGVLLRAKRAVKLAQCLLSGILMIPVMHFSTKLALKW